MIGMQIIKDATGDYPVYPGHPLVVAFEIISVFPTPESALAICKDSGLNCPGAVADNRITGGGGEVHAACNLLRKAQQGMEAGELIALADQWWVSGGAGGHAKAVEPGLLQAAKLKHEFPVRLATWLAQKQSNEG